jgi:predicted protein tyrosine phosphatase
LGFSTKTAPSPARSLRPRSFVALSDLDAKILIYCLVGIDRTPFLAMVYVSKKYNVSYEAAYKFVVEKSPNTRYHWDWVGLLGSSETEGAVPKK